MANVQKEHGYVPIANQYMDALIMARVRGRARKILDFIVRKTWGFNKKSDIIAIKQFEDATGLDRRHIKYELKYLEKNNLIIRSQMGTKTKYQIQKDYKKWGCPNWNVEVPKWERKGVPKWEPTKDSTKDNNKRQEKRGSQTGTLKNDSWRPFK